MEYVRIIEDLFKNLGKKFSKKRLGATEWATSIETYFREITEEMRNGFAFQGYNRRRPFFPHRTYYFPRAGPDALKLSYRMCGERDPNKLWEIVLYATIPLIDEFPDELFFDDELIWHQQQFGKKGHLAFAYLVVRGDSIYGLNYVSDIVQRQSKRMDYRTRINMYFRAWHYLLLNSIMNFALENNIRKFFSPTSDLVMKNTDPSRSVQRELFERIYDRVVHKCFRGIKKKGTYNKWWVIDVEKNRDRSIVPVKKKEIIENRKSICICHDIEHGFGHIDSDPDFAEFVERNSPTSLEQMLTIEKEMQVKATYNVLGRIFNQVREKIGKNGHCIAFHSYDHDKSWNQLGKCREIDYRVKGYRPPKSKITFELRDENLCYYNFEWLASSSNSLNTKLPRMENRVVKIPILFDDYDMYHQKMRYKDWEQKAIERIKQNDFVAFCLHDCYAYYWLSHYRRFLKKIIGLGNFKTLNEIANEVIFASCMK